MRLTLCLLTWNEIEGCRHDVPKLPIDRFEEVFAVDAGSDDGTVEYLQSRGIVVHRQDRPTYNGAYRCAFDRCTTDALVLFQPKGSINPAEVLRFRPLFEAGADLVIASRIGRGARTEEDDQVVKHRKWFVVALALMSAALWRRKGCFVWDVLHGFRGMRASAFRQIDTLPEGVSIDLEMVVRAYKQRLSILSFPVQERRRLAGSTHFRAWRTGKALLKYCWREIGRPA